MACLEGTSLQHTEYPSQLFVHSSEVQKDVVLSAQKTQYVYTIKQEDFRGETLFPLNQMKEREGYRDIYTKHIKKYEGREGTMESVISVLNCLWNDVIFLSPLHPYLIYKELKNVGYHVPELSFFQIPVEILIGKRTTNWLFPPEATPGSYLHANQFKELDCKQYIELKALPERTSTYFRDFFAVSDPGKLPLKFMHIPHVMCQDSISINDKRISIIKWSDPSSF